MQKVRDKHPGHVPCLVHLPDETELKLLMEPESYEATKARLEEEGITVEGRTGDPTCIYFDDPDGHRLQLLYKGHDD